MTRPIGMKLKQRAKPTDLFCKSCLEQVVLLFTITELYLCESCVRSYARSAVLTFDEMIEAKFERVKRKNINILKG